MLPLQPITIMRYYAKMIMRYDQYFLTHQYKR